MPILLRLVSIAFMGSTIAMASSSSLSSVTDGNREFACRLYQELAREPGNLFFSPHSISVALAMTYVGAREETATQMRDALSLTGAPDEVAPLFDALDVSLAKLQKEDAITWAAANSLWPHERFAFQEEFLNVVRTHFRSDVYPIDFDDGEAARLRINGWVEEKTQEKIMDLIPSGVLNALTRMVLVNAVYFKGAWETPFSPDLTTTQDFTMADGSVIKTPTMYGKISLRYAEVEGAKVLELPYKGRDVVMLVVLPNEPEGLPSIESSLNIQQLAEWQNSLNAGEVRVFLPKFTMTSQFSLPKTLSALGMTDAFIEGVANFSGMDGNTNNLFISDVVHKAFVDVSEKGTEAAAATAVIMQARAMPRPVPEFRADHPFLFVIQDRATQSVLFAGRLADPR